MYIIEQKVFDNHYIAANIINLNFLSRFRQKKIDIFLLLHFN